MNLESDRHDRREATGLTNRERDLLRELLHAYNAQPDQRQRIVEEIERRFTRDLAILVIDSSGFSRAVRSVGIVHFLALLERLGEVVRPLIAEAGGRLLFTEADNFFAAFPDAAAAVRCAEAILRTLRETNAKLPENEQLYISLGIGYGPVLIVDDATPYGDEMNLACKLGEDLARRDELLLTPRAYEALADHTVWRFAELAFSVSGLELRAYRLEW